MNPLLQRIWERYVSGDIAEIGSEITDLLLLHGIRIRQRDGEIMQINLSIPTTDNSALVIGLRYIKSDKTYTEDHFLCSDDSVSGRLVIMPYYRGSLEGIFPEYRGNHKQQLDANPIQEVITQVNTISHTLNKKCN